MKIFLMKINVSACTLENSSHIFFSVPGKLPPGKFRPGKFPPRKLPPGIFLPMFLNIPKWATEFFFFHYCHHHHWYYLKDLSLSFKSAKVFTIVNICQNEGLSEGRQLMKWVGIFQVRIFWVAIFRGDFSGRSLMGGNFSGGNSPGWNFHRTIFFI